MKCYSYDLETVLTAGLYNSLIEGKNRKYEDRTESTQREYGLEYKSSKLFKSDKGHFCL